MNSSNNKPCPARVSGACAGGMRVAVLYILSLMIGMLVLSNARADQADIVPVRSACEVDYPPFCFVNQDGQADGFAVELLRAVLGRMEREVSFRTGLWPEVRGWLEQAEVDALPLVGRTPERELLFDFTVPYMTMNGAIVVREETLDVETLEDLRGRRVGVMQGDNAEEFLRRKDRGFEIITTLTFSDAFRALLEKRCDAVVAQQLVAYQLLAETGLSNLKIIDQPISEFSQNFCFAVREGDREMLSILNEGLSLAVVDGTQRRLHAKWFAALELPSNRPLLIGGDRHYPPFEYLDKNGRPTGFTVELTQAIAREMNMSIHIQLGEWESMVNALRDGRIDALEGMFYSTERDQFLDFSPKFLVIHCVSIARHGAGKHPVTIEDLAGLDLVVQAEDAILDTLRERGIEPKISTVKTQEDVVRAVAEGRNDYGLGTRFGALHALKKNGWTNIDIGDQVFYSGDYAYAVAQGNDALLAQFAEGLRLLKDSGEYQRLYDKWLGVYEPGVSARTILRYFAIAAVPLLLIVLSALLWMRSLKQQVAIRTRELQATEKQLRESERFVRAVLDNLPVGVAVNSVGPIVEFRYMNDSFPRIYRTSKEALSSPDAFWEAVYHDPGFRTEIQQRVIQDCESGDPQRMSWENVPITREGEETTFVSARDVPVPEKGELISLVWDVTERWRAEEESLRLAGERKLALDAANLGWWQYDPETKISRYDERYAEIFGVSGSRCLYEDFLEILHPDDRPHVMASFGSALDPVKPKSYRVDYRINHRDSGIRWIEAHGLAVFGDRGLERRAVSLVGTVEDITERKMKEEKIFHLTEVLRAVRNVNQLSIHEKNRDTLLRRACETLTETRGYHSAWIGISQSDGTLRSVGESGIGPGFQYIRDQFERGDLPECCRKAIDVVKPLIMHDIAVNCVDSSLAKTCQDTATLAARLHHAGREYGCLVVALPAGMAEDAEEQLLFMELAGDLGFALYGIETDEEREIAMAAVRDSEARYRTLFEASADGILITNVQSREFRYANPAMSRLLGYSEAELITMDMADIHPKSDLPRIITEFDEQLKDTLTPAKEVPFQKKDGSIVFTDVSSAPITLNGQQYSVGFFRDISERKRAETDREKLQAQLVQAQKMEAVGRLAGGVAHDYNNILSVIIGNAELALDKVGLDDPLREDLVEILAAAKRSKDTTRQLLAFARKQTIAPEVLDLNSTVESILKILRKLVGEDIDLIWRPGDVPWLVLMDPSQIDQILANLCVNARDAISDTGKITIETSAVTIEAEDCSEDTALIPGDYIVLVVSDDGCGMDRETMKNLFEPFFTTKGLGKGTGLGLSMVYGVVKQNNGFINVYSEPDQGTTFRIYLPKHSGEIDTKRKPADDRVVDGNGETVLVVEDEVSILKLAERILSSHNYKVLVAQSPGEALEFGRTHSGDISLLITDVVMPGMNGRELADQMKQLCPGIKCVFMSGYTADVIAHRGVLDEGLQFIQKPFSNKALVAKVREALDQTV